MYNSSYKYNNVDIIGSMLLALFNQNSLICHCLQFVFLYVYIHLMSVASMQKNQVL